MSFVFDEARDFEPATRWPEDWQIPVVLAVGKDRQEQAEEPVVDHEIVAPLVAIEIDSVVKALALDHMFA